MVREGKAESWYTGSGISHQEACGKPYSGPLSRSFLMSFARKDVSMLRFHTVHTSQPVGGPTFQKGEDVFLAKGSYQGTIGTFLHLKSDANWADILEQNSQIRSHPVEWLRHLQRG